MDIDMDGCMDMDGYRWMDMDGGIWMDGSMDMEDEDMDEWIWRMWM